MKIILGSGKNRQQVEIPHKSIRSNEEQERLTQDALRIKFPDLRTDD